MWPRRDGYLRGFVSIEAGGGESGLVCLRAGGSDNRGGTRCGVCGDARCDLCQWVGVHTEELERPGFKGNGSWRESNVASKRPVPVFSAVDV